MLVKNFSKKLLSSTIILAVFIFLFFVTLSFFEPTITNAKDALSSSTSSLSGALGSAGPELGTKSTPTSLPILIGRFFQVVLGVLGLVYMCLLVYGGYSWFTASGESEKAQKANQTLQNASWGILIVLVAFVITTFAVTNLTTAIIPTK